jgi:hypothetical protein
MAAKDFDLFSTDIATLYMVLSRISPHCKDNLDNDLARIDPPPSYTKYSTRTKLAKYTKTAETHQRRESAAASGKSARKTKHLTKTGSYSWRIAKTLFGMSSGGGV